MTQQKTEDLKMIIEKNVPVPKRGKLPFKKMEIGDSVFFGADESPKKMQVYAHTYGNQLGRKFITRKEAGGMRIWRIE